MKLISELLRMTESVMSDKHVELQELIASKFKLNEDDAVAVLDFATGDIDWYELSDTARDRLYNHYAEDMPYGVSKARTGDPIEFIFVTLQKDLKL